MKEKILQMIDAYWKFDKDQQPISSWHDKQDLLKEIEELLESFSINNLPPIEKSISDKYKNLKVIFK